MYAFCNKSAKTHKRYILGKIFTNRISNCLFEKVFIKKFFLNPLISHLHMLKKKTYSPISQVKWKMIHLFHIHTCNRNKIHLFHIYTVEKKKKLIHFISTHVTEIESTYFTFIYTKEKKNKKVIYFNLVTTSHSHM